MGIKRRRTLSKALTYFLLIAGVGIVFIPFWYMIVTSLKPQSYIFEIPPRLWPQEATLRNYSVALGKDLFGLYFLNSLVVAVATTGLTIFITSMLAYAFARLRFPLKEPLFYLLLLGMMIPPVMLIIPQFIVSKQLGLLDSLGGLVLVYITMNLAMQTFLLRGFFEDIPRELEDAALI
ncbi:MAG: carbohydrate ABC transporter permease, partial [Chloroflexi bacterium]|nr:carbohydrate ABC transporter permease [Chloroflexota bacterium]